MHIPFVCMAKSKFLAHFPVDHLADPVISVLFSVSYNPSSSLNPKPCLICILCISVFLCLLQIILFTNTDCTLIRWWADPLSEIIIIVVVVVAAVVPVSLSKIDSLSETHLTIRKKERKNRLQKPKQRTHGEFVTRHA